MKSYSKMVFTSIVVAFAIIAVSACSSSPSTTAPADNNTPTQTAGADNSGGTIKIDSTKLMQDNGSGAAGDEVTSFKPTNHVQYFDASLSGMLNVGSKVNWVFTAVDTTAGKDVKITEVNNTVLTGNHLVGNLSMEKDFPVGKYKIDISVDGKPIGTIEYTVAE